MNNLKNQNGFVSIILLVIALLILGVAVLFCLDIFEIIDVPKEYSLTRFLDSSVETVYQGESTEGDNIKKVIKKTKKEGYNSLQVTNVINSDGKIDEEEIDDYNRYYYYQLDDSAKMIYEQIINNLDNMKSGDFTLEFGKSFNDLLNSNGGEDILNDYFQSAVNAILLDNPNIFYLDITKMYLLTKSTSYPFTGTTYEVSIGVNDGDSYLNDGFTKETVKSAIKKVNSIEKDIVSKASGNDLDKIKYVHDYLLDNFEYDSTFSNSCIYNVYGGFVNNLTVCEGYAKAFKAIMDEFDIPCVVICGMAENSNGQIENHAWDYVKIDDKWYSIDCTWDDPIVVGGGKLSEESKYKYYLKGSNTLFLDHHEDGEIVDGANFSYPTLNKEDYE